MAKTNYTLECLTAEQRATTRHFFELTDEPREDFMDEYVMELPSEFYDALIFFEFFDEDADGAAWVKYSDIADEVNEFVERYN